MLYLLQEFSRLGRGDRLLVLDGRGMSYQAVIEDAGRTRVVCAVTGEIPVFSSPGPRITLVQGLPKADKMDLIVEKATELGVSRIIPLVCERSVLKLEGTDYQDGGKGGYVSPGKRASSAAARIFRRSTCREAGSRPCGIWTRPPR